MKDHRVVAATLGTSEHAASPLGPGQCLIDVSPASATGWWMEMEELRLAALPPWVGSHTVTARTLASQEPRSLGQAFFLTSSHPRVWCGLACIRNRNTSRGVEGRASRSWPGRMWSPQAFLAVDCLSSLILKACGNCPSSTSLRSPIAARPPLPSIRQSLLYGPFAFASSFRSTGSILVTGSWLSFPHHPGNSSRSTSQVPT